MDHCNNLTQYLYNDNLAITSYGNYLKDYKSGGTNTYADAIKSLAYQGLDPQASYLSTNHVIKCSLDTINHFLNIVINHECISWGKIEDLRTGQPTSSRENKSSMLISYRNIIDSCIRAYRNSNNYNQLGGQNEANAKLSFMEHLNDMVDEFVSTLNVLQRNVQKISFLYFLENLFNFVEDEYEKQKSNSKPANSIGVITSHWATNLMSTAVTPYFIYLAWQQYWAGIQKFYKEKEGEKEGENEGEKIGMDLDDSISNCLTIFDDPNCWKIMISDVSDNPNTNRSNANKLIDAATKFLSKKAYDTRKSICVSPSPEKTKHFTELLDDALNKFQTDRSSIYKTEIGDIRVIYEKNKDVVTKVLFWNLFTNLSQQSLPFSTAMLYPNIMKIMKDHSSIFGSIDKSTGLLSILNTTNPNFQQLLQFKNGLTYKTTNGPTLSVEEIDYYKTNLPKQATVFRELGNIKPYFIDQHSTYQNYLYNKMKIGDMNKDYKKYTLTNLPPKYPSLGYFPLRSEQVAYGKNVDDNTKNEYNLYISNKIINLEPEFDITYKTSDSTSFDISDFINEYIADKYKDVLGEDPTLDKIKQLTSLYKLEHTHIDTEIVDNEYYTVYKLKIKLK
jgi:hypothetical protein